VTYNVPTLLKSDQKIQKCHQCRQNACQRFLAMSAMIGCIYALNFDRATLQGVQSDSLDGLNSSGAASFVDTLALHAYFARTVLAIILYVL
jgi:hypothetical protein